MVNSESLDSDGNHQQRKECVSQPNNAANSSQSPSPVTATAAQACCLSQTPDTLQAIEPTATKTEVNSTMSNIFNSKITLEDEEQQHKDESNEKTDSPPSSEENSDKTAAVANSEQEDEEEATKTNSLFVSVPLTKVQEVLSVVKPSDSKKVTKKFLCLYCDRTFVSQNLKQKHVDRCHSIKQNRRASSRFQNQQESTTGCLFCNSFNGKEHSLQELFQHLVSEHRTKYFGCLKCEERFPSKAVLTEHNSSVHELEQSDGEKRTSSNISSSSSSSSENSAIKNSDTSTNQIEETDKKGDERLKRLRHQNVKQDLKTLRNVRNKNAKNANKIFNVHKRTTRLQAKLSETLPSGGANTKNPNIKRGVRKNLGKEIEKIPPKPTNSFFSMENIFTYKKITDHSIDNLRISSLTFDDVFDKAFFNRMNSNIRDNLLNHIDGKLFKNEESESRISNFEKTSSTSTDSQSNTTENFGCELSLNAATPVPSTLLTSQLGEEVDFQIEYGSKASKKKPPPAVTNDEVHYKYFTRRKYQASLKANNENRDLSKLDMWTQMVVKNRQQKIIQDKKTEKEMIEYTNGDEYKAKIRVEDLNRILDKRGPFVDLKEEANKKAALDKLNEYENVSPEVFQQVREVLNEILDKVEESCKQSDITVKEESFVCKPEDLGLSMDLNQAEFLGLCRAPNCVNDTHAVIDKSDKITLICSSQETEQNLEQSKTYDKDSLVGLTGEWTRPRIYICAACGFKLHNIKFLMEHKNIVHPNAMVQHYEFVGNQCGVYRNLNIPGLGKVADVEDNPKCKQWKRSEARTCTKCEKVCNSLGELHRHMLECGEDWSWMLCRKKCKYRPFGAKSRRKRRAQIRLPPHAYKRKKTEGKMTNTN